MKKQLFLLIALSSAFLAGGQIIKIQVGSAVSKLNWQLKGINIDPFYRDPLVAWSFLAGVDYMDRKYFNLSSNIGMIRKGGQDRFPVRDHNGDINGEYITTRPYLDYLTINTCIDFKYRIKEKYAPFIGIGPRFDYSLSHSKEFDPLVSYDDLRKTAFGFLLGAGLKYQVSGIQLELRADYYHDFTKIAEWQAESQRYGGEISVKTYTLNLSVGYKLK